MSTRMPMAIVVSLAFAFLFACGLWAQQPAAPIRILYTGRLLGYYYALDDQAGGFSSCPDSNAKSFSPQSKSFIESVSDDAILVGTGDNFAPYLESRQFQRPRDPGIRAKELYTWDYIQTQRQWIKSSDFITITAKADKSRRRELDALDAEIQAGKGWIPGDNVACFLKRAHYDAIVPGKHDFYFGPERLRSLARLLATSQPGEESEYKPVQMLGSNLVIKTTWVNDLKLALTPKKTPARFMVAPSSTRLASLKPSMSERGSVYPWLQFIEVTGLVTDGIHGYLWDTQPNDPTDIVFPSSCPDIQTCPELVPRKVDRPGKQITRFWLNVPRSRKPMRHFTTLQPGKNYAFCLVQGSFTASSKDTPISCTRFSVYQPFFLHPATEPTPKNPSLCQSPLPTAQTLNDHCYNDPEPFVLKEWKESTKTPVVIFGVVDPKLKEHVGELNASWRAVREHQSGKDKDEDEAIYRTEVSAEEPAEALEEMGQYFDRKYCLDFAATKPQESSGNDECNGTGSRFPGLRILLAEMTPAAAQELAARMPEGHKFDVVIPQANDDIPTPDQVQIMSKFRVQPIRSSIEDPEPAVPDGAFPPFMAIPPQAWPSAASVEMQSPIRSLQMTQLNEFQRLYEVGEPNRAVVKAVLDHRADWAQSARSKLLLGSRSPSLFRSEALLATNISSPAPPCTNQDGCEKSFGEFVLRAMQKKTNADVTILQKRDFYWEAARRLSSTWKKDEVQKILDAIIWKGDFLTVQAVPGSTLIQVMKESKGFDQRDQDNLSLELERGRGLIKLGISESPIPGEYLINDVPLDPGRLYAIVTTDYMALGDTGYPELAVPAGTKAFDPQYSKTDLQYISSVVCEKVTGGSDCASPVQSEAYFDELANITPADLRPRHAEYLQFRDWFFHSRRKPSAMDGSEKGVQERPIWSWNLEKLSLGYGALYHKFSETDLNNFFGGVQNSDATSPKFISWNLDEKDSFTKSHANFDAFASQDLTYIGKFTAQQSGPSKPSQQANRMEFDAGSYFHLSGDRTIPHWDVSTVLHLETQFATPITQLKVTPANPADPHDNTLNIELGRTWTLLGRIGPRWHDRRSYIEGGMEGGRDLNAITAFQFVNQQGTTIGLPCTPAANTPLQTCVKGDPAIDTNSRVQVQRKGRTRTGVFWHGLLDVPIIPKVTESLENEGDFFFNSSGDNSTDTRLRHLMTNKIKFQVFPSLSFSPTYQVFLFRNKVDDHFLWQQQATITIDFSFNLTNWRVHETEFEYKKPADKK